MSKEYQQKKEAIARYEEKIQNQGFGKLQIRCHQSLKTRFEDVVHRYDFDNGAQLIEELLNKAGY